MKTPFHRFKNAYRSVGVGKPDSWSFCEMYGWLGSGIFDRNGREIYEGDRVKFGELGNTGVIEFSNSMFVIQHDNSYRFTVLGNTAGFVDVEVVGHIAEEQP